MFEGAFDVLCIKNANPCFTKGDVYRAEWSNKVLTSAPQLLVTDDIGHEGHIVAEGELNRDEWFNEHFVIVNSY